MNVKLLNSLLLAAEQSPSAYQSVGYRMPLAPVDAGQLQGQRLT